MVWQPERDWNLLTVGNGPADGSSMATHSAATWPADSVRRGAVLIAAVTLVARAAWALGQPDPGVHVERLVTLSAVVDEAVSHLS
ncbi:hypothetical protein EV137_1153 [Kribbella pratensis]|uniref:MftR C-terminal domain-containing protein n=1 Tax=Kribbella pratensis TaxID=2512112 RepID=A0ABY2FL45_9ACTN|nr:hypothetical protein EV137_1153 [Kribbella pratensis]